MVIHGVDKIVVVAIMKDINKTFWNKTAKNREKIELVSYHGNQNKSKCENYTLIVRSI